jgi:hypothetical protein
MNLTPLQKAYMKKLTPIEKAQFTFDLLATESKDPFLYKISQVCKESKNLENPLVEAGRTLSFMLASEELTLDQKSSILSAIDVLERIREKDLAEKN